MIKFFKDRPKLCTFLYILGFITSGVLTLKLLTSNSADTFSKLIAGSMTIILEFGKGITFIESQRKQKYTDGIKSLLFSMWLFLTALSIFASQAWLVNETNKIENNAQISSPLFLQAKDKESRLKDQITLKKTQLQKTLDDKINNAKNVQAERQDNLRLTSDYNKTIKEYQNKIESKNHELQQAIFKKWVNTPDKLRAEISQLKDTLNKTIAARDKLAVNDKTISDQTNIDRLGKEIDSLNIELNSIDYAKIKGELPANGYLALFQLMAEFVNLKTSTVTFLFYLLVTVMFEILTCLLYHIAVVYSPASQNNINDPGLLNKIQELVNNKNASHNLITSANLNAINGIYKNSIGDFVEHPAAGPQNFYGQSKPNETFEPTEPLKTKNPIGFRPEYIPSPTLSTPGETKIEIHIPDAMTKEDIQRYLKVMYSKTVGDIAPGSDRIAKILTEIGYAMTKEQARKIRGILEQHGIVKSHKEIKKTVVLKWI